MEARIELLPERKLVGKRIRISLTNNKTAELFQGFMPKRKEIKNTIGTDIICMREYDALPDFKNYDMNTVFDKWAAVEVADFTGIPEGMESFVLKGGMYAVFDYKGNNSPVASANLFQYIFGTWLPNSAYELDDRPHFEILGAKYKNNDPDSEEEICIPVKAKRYSRLIFFRQ